MTNPNRLKEAWAEGRTAFGLWAVLPGQLGAEILAASGPDYVCVDCQHGVVSYSQMVAMLAAIDAAGATPLARVATNDLTHIGKALDAGARGIIVPLVESAGDAARAAAACRYPPEGNRSYGPIRAPIVLGSREPEMLNRDTLCLVMVETKGGLQNVEEIVRTPGVDGVYIGPADLALSLGVNQGSEEHAAAVERIRAACELGGVAAGMHTTSGEGAGRYAEAGFDAVTCGMDSVFLSEAARRQLAAARGDERR